MEDITVDELKQRLDQGESLILIDVRQPEEHQAFNIGGKLVPLGLFPAYMENMDEEDKEKEIILYCRSGRRSGIAKHMMLEAGFEKPRNLLGGMLDWAGNFGT